MRDVCKQICRLCLEVVPDGNCEPISEIDKEILEVLLIRIDFDISDNVACKRCVQKVQDYFDFKSTCFYVDDYITPFVYTDIRVDIKKVFQKVMTKKKVNLDNVKICRLCMTLIENNTFIYNTDLKGGVPLKDVVRNCLPEVDLNTVHEPTICELCLGSLERLNDFMKTCHKVEQTIKNYKVAVGRGIPGRISLDDLLKFNNSRTLSTPTGIENDHLDAENALMCPRRKTTVNIQRKAGTGNKTSSSKRTKHKCHYCDYETLNIAYLKIHVSAIHKKGEVKVYYCQHCTFKTLYSASLCRHDKIHEEKGLYKCPCCEISFSRRVYFDNHLLKNHDSLRHLIRFKIHYCKFCTFETVFLRTMICHMARNHNTDGAKKFQCHKCDYFASVKSNLEKHLLVHSNLRPYLCTACQNGFTQKNNLDSHILSKHKENADLLKSITHKIHQCTFCTFETINSHWLCRHMESKHKQTSA